MIMATIASNTNDITYQYQLPNTFANRNLISKSCCLAFIGISLLLLKSCIKSSSLDLLNQLYKGKVMFLLNNTCYYNDHQRNSAGDNCNVSCSVCTFAGYPVFCWFYV